MGEQVEIMMGSTFKGGSEIKRRPSHKRVLLVLDDIDKIQQLDLLAGGCDWFGPGSRIIITTRDKDVLDNHVLDDVKIKKYCINGESEGMVHDFSIVIKKLMESDLRRNVVSIIGMGGLGKTTLARKIYNNHQVKQLFPCRTWGNVSYVYRARELFSEPFEGLMSSTSEYKDLSKDELKKKVRECLRYVVVLDDLSNLQTLKIGGTVELPLDVKAFPSNLTKIALTYFYSFDSSNMNTLGQLSNLQILKLEGSYYSVFNLNCGAGEFPQLQLFHMQSLDVQSWRLDEGAMPRFRSLVIKSCHYSTELLEEFWSLTTLRKVQDWWPSTKLAKSLQNIEVMKGCKLIIKTRA